MLKTDVLREKKRLKAVRRRRREIKNHNYVIKTLEKPPPILESMTEAVKDTISKLINFNRERMKSRFIKGGRQ